MMYAGSCSGRVTQIGDINPYENRLSILVTVRGSNHGEHFDVGLDVHGTNWCQILKENLRLGDTIVCHGKFKTREVRKCEHLTPLIDVKGFVVPEHGFDSFDHRRTFEREPELAGSAR